MANYLYIEGASGISGDMIVAALLDMGASRDKMEKALNSLSSDEFHYHIERKNSYSIAGLDFAVHHHEEPAREEHYHEHQHEHPHPHEHEHEHEHEHHHHHHIHRHLSDVYAIINQADMTASAKTLAQKIFDIVATAEAKAHGVAKEEVHFHEVGAIDSIVDIISAAVLLDDLAVKNCIVSGLTEGQGTIMCQHGELPVPVPAVFNIAQNHEIILRPSTTRGEMVTPTGIAIAAAIKTHDKLPSQYKILKSGIGLGKRDFGHANFLRTMLIEDATDNDQMWVVESNIDDSTPEELGFAMEQIFSAGAFDVHYEPCYMKKCRPAYILRAITNSANLDAVEDAVFRYTSTIGLRKYMVERTCMERKIVSVNLQEGEAKVKISTYKDITRCQPEYESIKKLAQNSSRSFREIFISAQQKAQSGDYHE